jgi:hypothetical protein
LLSLRLPLLTLSLLLARLALALLRLPLLLARLALPLLLPRLLARLALLARLSIPPGPLLLPLRLRQLLHALAHRLHLRQRFFNVTLVARALAPLSLLI